MLVQRLASELAYPYETVRELSTVGELSFVWWISMHTLGTERETEEVDKKKLKSFWWTNSLDSGFE